MAQLPYTTGPIIKYVYNADGILTEVTDDVSSWQDLEVEVVRDGTSGVFVESSTPIILTGSAYQLAKGQFYETGLYSKSTIEIHKRLDHSNDYELIKKVSLDFSTYKERRNTIEIQGFKNDLNEFVNSGGKTKYDIPTSDLSPEKWEYSRLNMKSGGSWSLPEGDEFALIFQLVGSSSQTFPLNLDNSEMPLGGTEHYIQTQDSDGTNSNDFFFKADGPVSVTVTLNAFFQSDILDSDDISAYIAILKNGNISHSWQMQEQSVNPPYGKYVNVNQSMVFNLSAGDYLQLVGVSSRPPLLQERKISVGTFTEFSLSYYEQGAPFIGENAIDIINPVILLQRYLDLITEEEGKFTGVIKWKPKDYDIFICAAESIRGFEGANLHGSLDDFIEWMYFLGYEYDFEDGVMTFSDRNGFYSDDTEAMVLTEREVSDLIVSADQKNAYSSVKIGYEKQDYDSINGRCEVNNGAFSYSTGYNNGKENVLSLISPYRADAIGIELLTWERGNKTTDTDSDNDIFFVAVTENNGKYYEYSDMDIIDNESEVSMFNAPFNPYFIALENESLIGVNTQNLKFASSEGNRNAKVQSTTIVGDIIQIEFIEIYNIVQTVKRIFDPVKYNFSVGTFQYLPDPLTRNGYVSFLFDGEEHRGFIESIKNTYAKNSSVEYTLNRLPSNIVPPVDPIYQIVPNGASYCEAVNNENTGYQIQPNKEQVSYDNGQTWADTGVVGYSKQQNSASCPILVPTQIGMDANVPYDADSLIGGMTTSVGYWPYYMGADNVPANGYVDEVATFEFAQLPAGGYPPNVMYNSAGTPEITYDPSTGKGTIKLIALSGDIVPTIIATGE